MNRKNLLSLISILTLLLPVKAYAAAGEAQLLAFSGSVEVRTSREGQWAPASDKADIPEGGAVRTGSDGGAVVLMPNKTKVWLKESSNLEVEQRQTLSSRLALLMGRMKVRVPHLLRKEKFEVRTPAAVCAVRGTEFTVETAETGAMNINVLYGEVKLTFVIPPDKGDSTIFIAQGRNVSLEEKGKPGKIAMMTPEQEKSSLENWNPGLSPAERQRDLKAKENDRAQIREFAKATNGTENSVRNFLNNVKESDIEAGRTLKDIHGNVVRVSQLLMRPRADEVQFVNLVKRPSYNAINNNSRNGGFNYNGGSVDNRLDYMQMTMNFNRDLPQSIEQWPEFFNSNSVKPDWASFVAANRTRASEIFFTASLLRYDAVKDDLVNNSTVLGLALNAANGGDRDIIVTGVIKDENGGLRAVEGLDRISKLQVADDGSTNGTLKYVADNSAVNAGQSDVYWAMRLDADAINAMDATINSPINPATNREYVTSYEKKGDPGMFNYTAQLYLVGNKITNDSIWLAEEASIINNSGSLQRVDDLVNTASDPFSILKNVAAETTIYVKSATWAPGSWANLRANLTTNENVFNNAISQNDYFTHGYGNNIDVVIIPDLVMAAVQKMLPAISKLSN